MKKPSFKIRAEIAKLQEQLKQAETREADQIGRIALRAGLGEMEIQEADLQAALEEVARRFRASKPAGSERKKAGGVASRSGQSETVTSGADAGGSSEA